MSGTNTTTVNVTLNPRLSGVTKVKVHSFPPGRCVEATLWICLDPAAIEKTSDTLSLHSAVQSVGDFEQRIRQDTLTLIDKERRQQDDYDDGGVGGALWPGDLTLSSWRLPTKSKLQKLGKRAAGIAASSATTPRTCKCV